MENTILLKSYLAPEVYNAVKAAAALKGESVQAFVATVLAREPQVVRLLAQSKRNS
jgi:hypothetical protein